MTKRKTAAWQRMPFYKEALLRPVRPSYAQRTCGHFVQINKKLYEARAGREGKHAKDAVDRILARLNSREFSERVPDLSVRRVFICCRAGGELSTRRHCKGYPGGDERWDF